MHLALYTFGQFIKPSDDTVNDGFHALNDPVLALVDRADGLIARSGYASDPGPASWGEEVYPTFYEDQGDGWAPATLSLWSDLESAFSFTYFGLHAEAMARGREWFLQPTWPPLVMWWHNAEVRPTWAEGVSRHKALHEQGPTPNAFTFKVPFDPLGEADKLNKFRVQEMRSNGNEV